MSPQHTLAAVPVVDWLHGLQDLRSPAALDRAILDQVHQALPQRQQTRPVLMLAFCLPCVLFGALANFLPQPMQPLGKQASNALVTEPTLRVLPQKEAVLSADKSLDARPIAVSSTQLGKAEAPHLAMARPVVRSKTRPMLAIPSPAMAVPEQRVLFGSLVPPRPVSAILPASTLRVPEIEADPPTARIADLSLATIRPVPSLHPMLTPEGLVAQLPKVSVRKQPPIYKRAWFVGVMGVAATGVAAGVTAAVATSMQGAHSPSGLGQPLSLPIRSS